MRTPDIYVHLGNALTGEVDRVGPYDFAQLTYNSVLRVERQDEGIEDFTLAVFRRGLWVLDDQSEWTDLTLSTDPGRP